MLHLRRGSRSSTFIATLAAGSPEWEVGGARARTPPSSGAGLTKRPLPSVHVLRPITGYDAIDVARSKGARDEEVFLYDADRRPQVRLVQPNRSAAGRRLRHKESGEGLGLLVDRRKVWGEASREHWLPAISQAGRRSRFQNALFQSRDLTDEGRFFLDRPTNSFPAPSPQGGRLRVRALGVGNCASLHRRLSRR